MDYKLAKQLKDAGFSQHGKGKNAAVGKPIKITFVTKDKKKIRIPATTAYKPPRYAYAPTLSELIEACGENFWGMNWWKNASEEKMWSAGNPTHQGHGKSPEEAVANLYLKLNEKA